MASDDVFWKDVVAGHFILRPTFAGLLRLKLLHLFIIFTF